MKLNLRLKDKDDQGFSLLELMMIIAILSILTIFGSESLSHVIVHASDISLQNTLLGLIEQGEIEAQATGLPIVLCASNDHKRCASNGSDTLLLFVNPEANGAMKKSRDLLADVSIQLRNSQLFWRAVPKHRPYLLFDRAFAGENVNATLWYCHQEASSPTWAIVINREGRARVMWQNHAGIIEDASGQALNCA